MRRDEVTFRHYIVTFFLFLLNGSDFGQFSHMGTCKLIVSELAFFYTAVR